MPVLRLDQASELWIGGQRASSAWIGGNRVWAPKAASLLALDQTPAKLSFFTIQSATGNSVILTGQNTNRRVATWASGLAVGDVVSFTYQSSIPLHARTATDLDLTATRNTLLPGVVAAIPTAFKTTLTYDAPCIGFLFATGAAAATLTITDFSITRPV